VLYEQAVLYEQTVLYEQAVLYEQTVLYEQKLVTFMLFIPCIVNDLHVLTEPTNTQFSYYIFHSKLPNLE
jgi:hypothetical protein